MESQRLRPLNAVRDSLYHPSDLRQERSYVGEAADAKFRIAYHAIGNGEVLDGDSSLHALDIASDDDLFWMEYVQADLVRMVGRST